MFNEKFIDKNRYEQQLAGLTTKINNNKRSIHQVIMIGMVYNSITLLLKLCCYRWRFNTHSKWKLLCAGMQYNVWLITFVSLLTNFSFCFLSLFHQTSKTYANILQFTKCKKNNNNGFPNSSVKHHLIQLNIFWYVLIFKL